MAWFKLGDQPKRSLRKGVYLRISSLTDKILDGIEKTGYQRENEFIALVKIENYDQDGNAVLQVWCTNLEDKLERYNVFTVRVKEDEEWICESDIGRGLKIKKT